MPVMSGLRKLNNNRKIAIRLSAKCLTLKKKIALRFVKILVTIFLSIIKYLSRLNEKNEEYQNYSKCQTGGCGYRITTFYFFFSF